MKKELRDFKKLLDFGERCLKVQEINIHKLRGAKKVLCSMFIASHNFSEGILCLCKEDRSHSCEPLLRSILDNLINAKFLYCDPRKNYHAIVLNGLTEKRKQIRHAIQFHKSNPDATLPDEYSLIDLENLCIRINKLEDIKQNIFKEYKNLNKTILKAEFIDKFNKSNNRKSESIVKIYFLIYRELSQSTHMSILSLNNFYKLENNETIAFLSGNPDDIGHILWLAIFLYKEMLSQFLKIFKNPLLKEFKEKYLLK